MICPCYKNEPIINNDSLQNEETNKKSSTVDRIKKYCQSFFCSKSSIQFDGENSSLNKDSQNISIEVKEIDSSSQNEDNIGFFRRIWRVTHFSLFSSQQENSPLLKKENEQQPSSIRTTFTHFGEIVRHSIHPKFIKGSMIGTSLAAITITSIHLAQLINTITENCYEAQMISPEEFNQCNAPFEKNLIIYNSILAATSLYLGYVLKKYFEVNHDQLIGNRESENSSEIDLRIDNLKKQTHIFFHKYCYEMCIGVGWLYNGIGIPVGSPSSFTAFQACMSAGLCVSALIVGGYFRNQQQEGMQLLSKWDQIDHISYLRIITILKEERKYLFINSLAIGIFVASYWITKDEIPQIVTEISREICILIVAQSVGKIISYIIENGTKSKINPLNKKISDFIARLLHLHAPFIAVSYGIYFTSTTDPYRFAGMSLLGITQGLQQRSYKQIKVKRNNPYSYVEENISICCKIGNVFKSYVWTGIILSFLITCEKFKFLDCNGPPSPLNYTCPIGLETSGYLEPNQVVIQSRGANLAIGVGVINYYVRSFIRYINKKFSEKTISKILKCYVTFSDYYQFQLISMIPYCLAKSAHYKMNYADFYSLDPVLPLAIMGFTFATYKEQINNDFHRTDGAETYDFSHGRKRRS